MTEIKREYLAGILLVTIMATAGITSISIKETGIYSTCTNGVWDFYNASHYKCSSNSKLAICHHLSSTNKTCYLGMIVDIQDTVITPQQETFTKDYLCYPDTDYCREKGLLSNPKVLKTGVK